MRQPQSRRRPTPVHDHCRAGGLTLIELMCVLAVLVVLGGGSVPGLQSMRQTQALNGVTETVQADVQYARMVAMTTDRTVRLSVQSHPDGGSCLLVHLGPAGGCACHGDGQATCATGSELLRVSAQRSTEGAALTTVGKSLIFDAGKGTVSPTATLKSQTTDGRVVHQVINILGRVRTCSPDGRTPYPRCA